MILILGHFLLTNPTKMFAMHILHFRTMLIVATHLRSVPQNFTGSRLLIPFMLRIAKNHSYSSSCHVFFSFSVKQSGLILLILICGDVAMNPGPAMLGLVNARSIRIRALSLLTPKHLTALIFSVSQKHIFVLLIQTASFLPSPRTGSH